MNLSTVKSIVISALAFSLVSTLGAKASTVVVYDDFSQPNYDTGTHTPYNVYATRMWDGAPGGGGLSPNHGTTPGSTVLGANLPGGAWQFGGGYGSDYDVDEVGNLAAYGSSNIKLTGGTAVVPYATVHNYENVALSLSGYNTSTQLTVSVDVCPQSNDCYVGFDSALNVSSNFSGLRVDQTGGVSLFVNGSQVGSAIAFTGTWSNATASLLTFTVNTSTGAISGITLQNSTSSYSFSTTAFTVSATPYFAFYTPAGSGSALFAYLQISSNPLTPPPSAPTGLTTSPGSAQVALSWTAVSGATGYNVYRGLTSGGESTTAIATGLTSPTYTNTGLTNGTTYYYKVTATNSSGASGYSNEASATPVATTATTVIYDDFSQPNYDTGTHSPYNVYATRMWDGSPSSGGLSPNNGTTPGNTVLGANLPGGTWQFGGGADYDYDADEVGNLSGYGASNIQLTGSSTYVPYATLHNNENVAISLAGYHTATTVTVSVYVLPQGNDAYVGFDSALNTTNNFSGLMVDTAGGLSLIVNGSQVGSTIAYTGTFSATTANLLTFSVNTSTGAISGISFQGSTSTYSFSTTAFTSSVTSYLAFFVPTGSSGHAIYAYLKVVSGSSGGGGSGGTTAVSANTFLNSISVCTHIAQGLDDPTSVATCLTYAGIRNIRDAGGNISGLLSVHTATGAKVCLLPNSDWVIADTLSQLEQLATAGALMAAEGPNEPNNFPVTYGGATSNYSTTFVPVAQFQRDLYSAVKADTKLTGIPVLASSEAGGSEPDNVGLQFLTIPTGAGTTLPSGTIYADYANPHNYIQWNGSTAAPVNNTAWQAEDPTLNGSWDGMYVEYGHTWHEGFTGYTNTQLATLPRVTTETGWVTTADSGHSNPVTLDQQGKLFLNLYLSAVKRGWTYTFIYYLHDTASQGYWGLFDTSYNAKLSGTYLHNLTTILADTTAFTPGVVNYTIPSEPSTVHDLLIQKSNGTFYLAVWDDRPVGSGSDAVTVNLGATYTANEYDPTVGTSATSLGSTSSVALTLTDHPVILSIH